MSPIHAGRRSPPLATSFNDEWLTAILTPLLPEGSLERLRVPGTERSGSLWERVLDSRLMPEAEVLAAL